MKNWGIKKRVLFLALLPTIIIALSLSLYFGYNSVAQFEATLHEKGQSLSRNLAPACEYGVFSGNMDILANIMEKSLQDDDVLDITISNNLDEPLISRSRTTSSRSFRQTVLATIIPEQQFTFTAPVTSTEINISDFDETAETGGTQIIGYVHITLSSLSTRIHQFTSVLKALLISAIGLLFTLLLATRISRSVVEPIQELNLAVTKIAQGQLSTRVSINAGGEIGVLEQGVNKMADEIQAAREDLQTQVDKATVKLKKAMDELEIQNIELDLARGRAISASRIKSEFLANMSHEIRTPMNGVIGFAELLEKTRLNEQQRDYVATIRNSASNLLTIIDDILDFSKIESGKLEIENISFSLPDIICEIIAMFAPMAYKKNIELIAYPYPEIPQQLMGDPARIRQILVNLIGNAIKFTSRGYVILRIISTTPVDGSINIKFTVSDTGIGMDAISKQRLFTAFTQADTSISRKFGGTGLGLVISKKLAVLMQGDIGFDSTLNRGTTFWLSVPLGVDPVQQETLAGISGRVLLCDSLDQTRIALRVLLNQTGLDTLETSSAEKIPQLLAEEDNQDIRAVVVGINRNNIGQATYMKSVADVLLQTPLPYLVIASTYDENELAILTRHNISNVVYRCTHPQHIKEKVRALLHGELISTQDSVETLRATQVKTKSLQNIHVLLVDDNAINLKLTKTFLENNQIRVTTAEDGEQALRLTGQQHFDLILMDLHMPKLDGFEAAERIRHNDGPSSNAIIIALTANAMPDEQQRIYRCGMNDVLLKPISEQQLMTLLARWLEATLSPNKTAAIQGSTQSIMEAIYDEKQGTELAGGNAQLARELLTMLIRELPDHKQRLEHALRNNDNAALKQATHKLHGATSYCGVPRLRKCARTLEDIIDNNEQSKLEHASLELLRAIDELLDYEI